MGLRIVPGTANPLLAAAVARTLRTELVTCELDRFPDGELRPVVDHLRGDDVYVIQPTGPPVSDHLVELLLLLDACRRGGAGRITAVLPYLHRDGQVRGAPWLAGYGMAFVGTVPGRRRRSRVTGQQDPVGRADLRWTVTVSDAWLSAEERVVNVNEDWSVSLSVAETDGQTRAEARLVMSGGDQLVGHGQARRNPADREVARIGAQLAAARALSDLAGQLLHAAATAVEDGTRERAHLDL